ncbi:flagellar protein, putative [Roseobacter sp. SK209-2-6]|uniref:DUF1217 domain-containing protein n=1 Tax=Roseobacter sp. SK209-2-6 TaxID=388739 RepID=UPI0000F3D08E|nr:DUF1217 domain-containing protein [Roseobacter sp. SK209-2-6]EBA17090.1 flagellar protein, putative [Roseobacter sp. SK209-2-6]
MSFDPILLGGGIPGWNFLQSTYDRQFEVFSSGAAIERESDYFLENIGKVETAEDLIKDRRLLSVALGAFGLEDQIDMKALVQKVLEEGSSADDALATRLGDDRWVSFTDAFGFGPGESRKTGDLEAMKDVVFTNKTQSFETAVGNQEQTLRVALYAERELVPLVAEGEDGETPSINTQWYNIIGQPQLHSMMQTALGLPDSIGQVDVDQQVKIFREASERFFGSDDLSEFSDPEKMSNLISTYLARSEIAAFNASISGSSAALLLLQS